MKRIINIFFILVFAFINTGAVFEIDAARNASIHNNIGVNYMKEKYYYGAIKEFEMAIQLNPNTQASATYYNNLGKAYLKIGYPELAEKSFNSSLERNSVNFEVFQNLVESYKQQNKLKSELKKSMADKKNLSKIKAGLIMIQLGQLESGINTLDEFCFDEPDMIITKGIKSYIQTLVDENSDF